MIILTNIREGSTGSPVALSPAHIVSVYVLFEGETRIHTISEPDAWIVSETFDHVVKALDASLTSTHETKT